MILGRIVSSIYVFKGSARDGDRAKTDVGLKWKFKKSETMCGGYVQINNMGKTTFSRKAGTYS